MLKVLARPALLVVLVAAGVLPILFIGCAPAAGPEDVANRTAVTNLVFAAMGSEGDVQLAGDVAALRNTYTGNALAVENGQLAHVQDLVHQGTDYPGPLHISQQKVLSVTGSGDSYVVQVQFHAVRDNMRKGVIIDHSVADVIWRVTVVKTLDGWRIAEMKGSFAPGSGP